MKLGSQRDLFEIPEDIVYLNCAYMSPQLRRRGRSGSGPSRASHGPGRSHPTTSSRTRKSCGRCSRGSSAGMPTASRSYPPSATGSPSRRRTYLYEKDRRSSSSRTSSPPTSTPGASWRRTRAGRSSSPYPVQKISDWTPCPARGDRRRHRRCRRPELPLDRRIARRPRTRRREGQRSRGGACRRWRYSRLGLYPFDVSQVRPDFLVAASYKWLLGPYGVGFMYVEEKYREGKPIEHNWINRHGSEDFSQLVDYQDAFQPGARRYDVGERSNFALLPMAAEALRQLLDWEVENVSETIGTLTDLIEEKAEELGIVTIPKERRARHMIGLMLGPDAPDDLATRLTRHDVFVSVRGPSVRVSPHLYNTEEDIDRLFDVLEQVAD